MRRRAELSENKLHVLVVALMLIFRKVIRSSALSVLIDNVEGTDLRTLAPRTES